VTVLVRLKPSLDDAQGRVVERALKNLGYDKVQKVRVGKLIEVWLDDGVSAEDAKRQVEEMCRQLLANPVVEEFEVLSTPLPSVPSRCDCDLHSPTASIAPQDGEVKAG